MRYFIYPLYHWQTLHIADDIKRNTISLLNTPISWLLCAKIILTLSDKITLFQKRKKNTLMVMLYTRLLVFKSKYKESHCQK